MYIFTNLKERVDNYEFKITTVPDGNSAHSHGKL